MKTYAAILLALFLGSSLVGCNTTRGLGQDIEATGDAIENTAEDAEEELED